MSTQSRLPLLVLALALASTGVWLLVARLGPSDSSRAAVSLALEEPASGAPAEVLPAQPDAGDLSRIGVESPSPVEQPAPPQAPAQKARGTEKRIVMQGPEYYLADPAFNPAGKRPRKEQLAALQNMVSAESLSARSKEAAFYSCLDRCANAKFDSGEFSSAPLGAVDEVAGVYMTQIGARGQPLRNIQVVLGEFAELDTLRQERIDQLAEAEARVNLLIASW